MQDNLKICHVSFGGHSKMDTRIYHKELLSLKKNYNQLMYVFNEDGEEETIDGIHFYPLNTKKYNKLKKIIFVFFKLKKILLDFDYDVYHFHDEILLFVALSLKKKLKKIIFDLHEDTYLQLRKEYFKSKILSYISASVYQFISLRIYSSLDKIIVTSPKIESRLSRYLLNVDIIPNYPKITVQLKSNLIKSSKFRIIFSGGITKQYSIVNVLDAINDLDVEFYIMGPISLDYKKTLQEHNAWSKTTYLGVLTKERVFEEYAKAHIGVVLFSKKNNQCGNEGCLGNNKIFEYMQMGLPPLVTNQRIWLDIIEKNGAGICVEPDNINQIKESVKLLIESPNLLNEMSVNSIQLIESKYNWEKLEHILFSIYEKFEGIV